MVSSWSCIILSLKEYSSQVVNQLCKFIIYRDLKPENLVYLNNKEDSPLKLIDFGLSIQTYSIDDKLSRKLGTVRLFLFQLNFIRLII